MLFFNGIKPFEFDNRLFRIWYLRKLYFHILKNDLIKLGFKNTAITQFPYAFSDADVPPAITLEFTNLCNLKCSYCTSPLKERPVGLMKSDIFNKIIKDINLLKISIKKGIIKSNSRICIQFLLQDTNKRISTKTTTAHQFSFYHDTLGNKSI